MFDKPPIWWIQWFLFFALAGTILALIVGQPWLALVCAGGVVAAVLIIAAVIWAEGREP